MTTLTAQEKIVLIALFESSNGNGHDFGFVEDCRHVVPVASLGGIISSLSKKGILTVHGAVTTDSGRWTQTTWDLPVEQVSALIA